MKEPGMEVKKVLYCALFLAFLNSISYVNADDGKKVYLNAFLETSTAYLNDAFLLIGAISDTVMTESARRDVAAETIDGVQRRVRIIRAKIKAVLMTRVNIPERKLLSLLDGAYACLDHQAWALITFFKDSAPESAKRFELLRLECLEKIESISNFYAGLPRAPELPEPLSTR